MIIIIIESLLFILLKELELKQFCLMKDNSISIIIKFNTKFNKIKLKLMIYKSI